MDSSADTVPSAPNPPGGPLPNKRKRKRVSRTCTLCRARKIKCDQGKPCTACKNKGIPDHLCIYEDSPFLPTPEDGSGPQEAIRVRTEEDKRLKAQLDDMKRTALLPKSARSKK